MYYLLRHREGQAKDLEARLGEITDTDAELTGLQELHEYTLQTFEAPKGESLTRLTEWGGKKRTALEFLFPMLDHDVHHRGQAATYLRVLEVERREGKDWRGLAYGH